MPYPFDKPRFDAGLVAEDLMPITLDADIPGHCIGLWVAAAGNVGVLMLDGTARTIPSVPASTYVPGRFTRVTTAGTTVAAPGTNILAARLIG